MFWRCEPEWVGETVFIVAGGPSVLTQDLELLRGRKIIAINSSVYTVPWASLLFFGDFRWWERVAENRQAAAAFAGPVVTGSKFAPAKHAIIKKMMKGLPPAFPPDRHVVTYLKTSITAALHLAVHRGASRVVLLGADGKAASDGRTHHHKPHEWATRRGCWDIHRKELAAIAPHIQRLGIPVWNASPGSAWDIWPVVTLQEALANIGDPCLSAECLGLATTSINEPSFAS